MLHPWIMFYLLRFSVPLVAQLCTHEGNNRPQARRGSLLCDITRLALQSGRPVNAVVFLIGLSVNLFRTNGSERFLVFWRSSVELPLWFNLNACEKTQHHHQPAISEEMHVHKFNHNQNFNNSSHCRALLYCLQPLNNITL